METRQRIIDVVNGVAIHADLRQWDQLRGLYADAVEVDYSSLVGGAPARVRADDLIDGWRLGLSRYQATQHLLGNHRVTHDGSSAQVLVYVQATHWLPHPADAPSWTVHGYYTYGLREVGTTWQITHHTLTATIVYGSRALLELQGVAPAWLRSP